jgi:hypothetical protein
MFSFLSVFIENGIFSTDFRKNTQIANFMKIRPMVAELFHMDGQVDRHGDASSRYSQFSKAPQTHAELTSTILFSRKCNKRGRIKLNSVL